MIVAAPITDEPMDIFRGCALAEFSQVGKLVGSRYQKRFHGYSPVPQ